MTETYSDFSHVCTRFYDLVVDPEEVAQFVYSKVRDYNPRKCLFVGGFFLVAKELQKLGLDLVIADYTEEMIREARKRLPNTRAEIADLRELPFEGEFDAVFVIGRVFTHMLTPQDSSRALQSIHTSLRPGGITLLDNYEDSKILVTNYFNGRITVKDSTITIVRESSTQLVSKNPSIVNWVADYHVTSNREVTNYRDEMHHRALSRDEMRTLFEEHDFEVYSQGDNFDETSFFTLAGRKSQA